MILDKKTRYLHIALNTNLNDAYTIISQLPKSQRILLEAGTPLIKAYGMNVLTHIKNYWYATGGKTEPYLVADLKTMDRAQTEVAMAKQFGASAAICMGQASLETIQSFIKTCQQLQIDSMLDMMNIEYPVKILRLLKDKPDIIILHRGVDEETFNKNKPIPFVQINKVLSTYNATIAIAGGDTIREVQRAIFNGAHIVLVWKDFYKPSSQTASLATSFLKEIK